MQLCVVVPIFNEQASVAGFVNEWLPALRKIEPDFQIWFIDAASTDGTLELLQEFQKSQPEVRLIIERLKHGPSCLYGYKKAVEDGAVWVLQLDSDGQCDPAYLEKLWQAREQGASVQGLRVWRHDGLVRMVVSRTLEVILFCLAGSFIVDPNCPYRFMHRDELSKLVDLIPNDFELTNVLLTYLYQRNFRIKRLPIVFRDRSGGTAKVNLRTISKSAFRFGREFKRLSLGKPMANSVESSSKLTG